MSRSPTSRPRAESAREQLLRECTEMIRYALSSGMRVPASLVQIVEEHGAADVSAGLSPLVTTHERLAKLVAPATPRALVLFAEEAQEKHPVLGSVPLVRRMMLAALVSVALFIFSSLSPKVNESVGGVLDQSGLSLLANELFWLSAAGLGASFAMLFQVNEYIVKRSYDPKYEASYWIKFLVGVISGFILATLIPVGEVQGAAEGAAGPAGAGVLAKPTLAMLGGFSASAVHRILTRLSDTVESFFRPDPRQEAALHQQARAARAAEESAESRLALASQLVQLRQQLAAGGDPAELSQRIGALVSSLAPALADAESGTAPSIPAVPAAQVPVPALADETGIVAQAAQAAPTP